MTQTSVLKIVGSCNCMPFEDSQFPEVFSEKTEIGKDQEGLSLDA